MKEVFIAKNGRPYVKDENGKVRFISSAEWKEYDNDRASHNGKWFMVAVLITLSVIVIVSQVEGLL